MYFLFFIFFKFFYNNSGIKPEFRISSPVIPKIRNSVFYKKMDSLIDIQVKGLQNAVGPQKVRFELNRHITRIF